MCMNSHITSSVGWNICIICIAKLVFFRLPGRNPNSSLSISGSLHFSVTSNLERHSNILPGIMGKLSGNKVS